MKKAIKNSVGILLLALALVVTQIPTTGAAAETSTASDFQMNGDILVKYVGTASIVSIPANVKRIGEEAFAGNSSVREISFKGNVEVISYRAFAECEGLQKIVLPDSLLEIGNGAFGNCTSLKEISIGKSLKKLGIGVFAGCKSLEKISVHKNNLFFTTEDGALYNKEKTMLYTLQSVRQKDTYTMPSTVTTIAEYAFWGSSIKTVSLGSGLKVIPAYAFSNCKSLISLAIPYSVTGIELMAFADCVNLETVAIPASVSQIHSSAFDGCPKLNIVADVGTAAYQYYETWKKTHENQVEYEDTGNQETDNDGEKPDSGENQKPEPGETGGDSQGQVGQLLGSSYVVANRAVVFIDNSASKIYGNTAQTGTEGEVPQGENKGEEFPVSGGNTGEETLGEVLENREGKAVTIPKFTVVGEQIVADQAFYKSSEMGEYIIPAEITQIGEFAFARSDLSRAAIPNGVKEIGYGAFYHCSKLRDVSIPSTVTNIEANAFEKTLWLENWKAGGSGDYLIVGDGILISYRGTGGDIVIPENVKQIAPETFKNNGSITGVSLPESLMKIGEGAFEGCKSLKDVTGGKKLTVIEDRAFAGCLLDSFHVSGNVLEMGQKAIDFSDIGKSISSKVVIFDGIKLPVPIHGDMASRLSNAAARGHVLQDVLFAIVDRELRHESHQGTVLDGNLNAFKGIIAYISSKERQTVTVCGSTLTAKELQDTYIPEYISVDGVIYQVEGRESLDSYSLPERKLENVGEIQVIQQTDETGTLPIATGAWLEGNNGYYSLSMKEGNTDSLNKGYQAVYGKSLPEGSLVFEMELKDRENNVEITKLGNSTLTASLKLPADLAGKELRVIALDRNGQLESVKYRMPQKDTIEMDTKYMSSYGIYRAGSSGGNMDASPDTGEVIHPKWIWATGLFCLSVLVFAIKPHNKKNYKGI